MRVRASSSQWPLRRASRPVPSAPRRRPLILDSSTSLIKSSSSRSVQRVLLVVRGEPPALGAPSACDGQRPRVSAILHPPSRRRCTPRGTRRRQRRRVPRLAGAGRGTTCLLGHQTATRRRRRARQPPRARRAARAAPAPARAPCAVSSRPAVRRRADAGLRGAAEAPASTAVSRPAAALPGRRPARCAPRGATARGWRRRSPAPQTEARDAHVEVGKRTVSLWPSSYPNAGSRPPSTVPAYSIRP